MSERLEQYKKDQRRENMRLNQFLSDAGVCSRRQADRLIMDGRVFADGHIAVLGEKVSGSSRIEVDGKPVTAENEKILLAFYKPAGIVCTANPNVADNIISYLNFPVRIYTIGRLDKNSEGLILLTNEGSIVNQILKSSNNKEKEYIVSVDREITGEFLKKMRSGVPVLDTVTKPCKVSMIDLHTFRIIITQGLNRQIRRMCEALGYRVKNLKRTRIMNIELGNLKAGEYRYVSESEIAKMLSKFGAE